MRIMITWEWNVFLILLQERFYWPKMSEDIRTIIKSCEHCMHFKTTPQHNEMYPITAMHP